MKLYSHFRILFPVTVISPEVVDSYIPITMPEELRFTENEPVLKFPSIMNNDYLS